MSNNCPKKLNFVDLYKREVSQDEASYYLNFLFNSIGDSENGVKIMERLNHFKIIVVH